MYFASLFFLFYMWLLETFQVSYGTGINTSTGSSALAWTESETLGHWVSYGSDELCLTAHSYRGVVSADQHAGRDSWWAEGSKVRTEEAGAAQVLWTLKTSQSVFPEYQTRNCREQTTNRVGQGYLGQRKGKAEWIGEGNRARRSEKVWSHSFEHLMDT